MSAPVEFPGYVISDIVARFARFESGAKLRTAKRFLAVLSDGENDLNERVLLQFALFAPVLKKQCTLYGVLWFRAVFLLGNMV